MLKEKYPHIEIQTGARVSLIGRTTAPISEDSLDAIDIQTLNSAAVLSAEAALTCYSQNLHFPTDYLEKSDKHRDSANRIITSTREAGHLTTRQHVYYTFALEGVSRQAVNFLHSHPHYNSEEKSQRYVNLQEATPIVPDFQNDHLNQEARRASQELIESYHHLYTLIQPTAKQEIQKRFPGRTNDKWEKVIEADAKKKAQEVARYLLPLGTPTNLYYSISELTLIRLFHLQDSLPSQPEIKSIIQSMVDTVSQVDPLIIDEVGKVIPPAVLPASIPSTFKKEFDKVIGTDPAKLDSIGQIDKVLARSVRLTLGISESELSDSEAISLMLDPTRNKLLTSVYGEIVLDHLSQCLNQVHLSSLVSLSHTANYQLQRHRGFHHTTNLQLPLPEDNSDFVIPTLLQLNSQAMDYYLSVLENHTQNLHQLVQYGADTSKLQYLLPNCTRVRKSISGPFGSYLHLIKTRTCLTAQEEIYSLALSLAKQISEANPQIGKFIEHPAPCGWRNAGGIRPQCPEGTRFCGVRIWDMSLADYPQRTI